MTKTLLIFCVLCAFLLIGCGKSETTDNGNTTRGNSNDSAKSTPAPKTAPAGEKIGVPECDDFIAKYEACVSDKVPEASRAQFNASITEWRKSWKQLAANPATKGTLAAACKQAAESARTSMKAYNCSF